MAGEPQMTREEVAKHAENLGFIEVILDALPVGTTQEVQDKRQWLASLDAGISALARVSR